MPAGRPATAADTVNIATRLIALLHRAPAQKPSTPDPGPPPKLAEQSKGVKLAIYCLIGIIFLLVGQWALSDQPAPAPTDTTIVPDLRK
jgi:hypothetical protein